MSTELIDLSNALARETDRAAASIDLEHDTADIDKKVACCTLAFWGANGVMHKFFDIGAAWRKRCTNLATATLPGGHFLLISFRPRRRRFSRHS